MKFSIDLFNLFNQYLVDQKADYQIYFMADVDELLPDRTVYDILWIAKTSEKFNLDDWFVTIDNDGKLESFNPDSMMEFIEKTDFFTWLKENN